jgi:hypothetical protein
MYQRHFTRTVVQKNAFSLSVYTYLLYLIDMIQIYMTNCNLVDTMFMNYKVHRNTVYFDTSVHSKRLLMVDIDNLHFDKLNNDSLDIDRMFY